MKECSMVAWVPLQWSSHFKKEKKGSVKDLSAVRLLLQGTQSSVPVGGSPVGWVPAPFSGLFS